MERDFTYRSADGITDIHAVEWTPEKTPRALLLIAHGMQEYIRRYTPFANWLNERGVAVCGNDHLGHGESVVSDEKHGYFGEGDGNRFLIEDMHRLRLTEEEKYPELPVFYLGHSMGSFLIVQYIMIYGKGLAGAVIMGTGSQGAGTLRIARLLAKMGSPEKPSPLLAKLSTGSYNKQIPDPRTPADWLSKDESICDRYIRDPWCTFPFTRNAYYHMFRGIQYIQKKENEEKIPKELPVFLVSGKEDPVGHYGKDIPEIFRRYQSIGIRDVAMKLYEGDRHEILNETDRETVYEDILNWMEAHMAES